MQGSSDSGERRCEAHELRLYPLSESTYNGQYYNVSFCTCRADKPPPRRLPKTPRPTNNLTFPRFNRDRNFSTPAFILNSERNYYESQGPKMRVEHERKMADYTEEKLQIHVAKPRSKNNYCSVCKSSYEDYLEHIHSEQHARRIRHSPFEKDIQELAGRYHREHRRKRTPSLANSNIPIHNPPVLDKNTSTRYEDSDEVEIISNPYKMRKPSHEVAHPLVSHQPTQMKQGMFIGHQGRQGERATSPFKPFSTTYQEQMSQFFLNLNIFLNPYPMGPLLLSPLNLTIQAKQQQLSMLQYSFFSQVQMQHHLQLQQLHHRPPPAMHIPLYPPAPPAARGKPSTFIVIDE